MNQSTQKLSLAVLALSALLLPSCAKKPATPDIKIGLIAELTGDIPAVGTSCKNAAASASRARSVVTCCQNGSVS